MIDKYDFTVSAKKIARVDYDPVRHALRIHIPSVDYTVVTKVEIPTRMINDTEFVMNAVRAWQSNDMVHPLTCGHDSSHAKLRPEKVDVLEDVILACPECGYRQMWIPHIILASYAGGDE